MYPIHDGGGDLFKKYSFDGILGWVKDDRLNDVTRLLIALATAVPTSGGRIEYNNECVVVTPQAVGVAEHVLSILFGPGEPDAKCRAANSFVDSINFKNQGVS